MAAPKGRIRLYAHATPDLVSVLDAYVAAHETSRSDAIQSAIEHFLTPSDGQQLPNNSKDTDKAQFNAANYSRAVALAQKASNGRLDPITAAKFPRDFAQSSPEKPADPVPSEQTPWF